MPAGEGVRRHCGVIAAAVAVLVGASGSSASASVTVLKGNEASTSLPTWANSYAWPDGDGYVGWTNQQPAPGGYAFAPGLTVGPALWLWPLGARRYAPGEALWSYEAPGTTRILSAAVDLNSPPRLLAHHCVRVALRSGELEPDYKVFCKPPGPPSGDGHVVVRLGDPDGNPSSKLLTAGIELPCAKRNQTACENYLSAGDPEGDGLRVSVADLVLVDDDLPVVTPSGAFFDLDGTYIDGRQSYPLRVDADDAGAGIEHIGIQHTGWPGPQPDLADHAAACDPHHHTPGLGTRICPMHDTIEQVVDTRPMPEGMRHFRAFSSDPAGNVGEHRWTVIIDRTPPTRPSLSFTTPEEGSAVAVWQPAVDPILPDGTPGSGVAHYRFRHRVGEGQWSRWTTVGAGARSGEEVYDQPAGTEVSFEVVAVDAVGNVSEVARASGRVFGIPPSVSTWGRLADAANGYLSAGSFPVTVAGDDGDGVGIKRLALYRSGGGLLAQAPGDCAPRRRSDGRPWKALCASTWSADFAVDTSTLPEGRQTFVAQATDRANNVGERRWQVTIDRTPPLAAQPDMTAFYSEELGDADVFWQEAADPPLPDGSPGSGVAGYVYRYERGGRWSGWLATDAATFHFAGAVPGERVGVELRSRDAAGNLSAPVSGSAIVQRSHYGFRMGFFGGAERLGIAVAAAPQDAESGLRTADGQPAKVVPLSRAVSSPAGRDAIWAAGIDVPVVSAGREPLERRVSCQIGGRTDGVPTLLEEYKGETNIVVRTTVGSYCFPANFLDPLDLKFAQETTLDVEVCLQVDAGHGWETVACRRGTKKGANSSHKLTLLAQQLCSPGERRYRTQVTSRASAPGLSAAKSTIRSLPVFRGCNEAGAWRRLARKDGDPGTLLGRSLVSAFTADIDRDPLPRGDGKTKLGGWQAHHIVPTDYGRRTNKLHLAARAIQKLAYTCGIPPNDAVNGLWLRGPRLYDGEPGWRHLTRAGRTRPRHQAIHTAKHFRWIERHLDSYATSGGDCLSLGGMYGALRRIKKKIIADDAPF